MAPVLNSTSITLQFPNAPQPVLDGFSLSVASGEFVAIVGGSGVGKSTLLRVLAGLLPAQSGTIMLNAEESAARRRRAIVFQDGRLMPWRTLSANVAYGLDGLKLTQEAKQARTDEVLRLTGLTELHDRYPHQLSGGQVQRAGIARALAVEPEVLFMDEPFSAVDALTRTSLQDELLRVWELSQKAIVFVTHDIAEAVFLADRVVVLSGSPARIALDQTIGLARPRKRGSAEVADLTRTIGEALSEYTI
ncbi:MAG: ABC transporter ATP-binding protein [Pseudomonadota bacterium]